MKPTAKSLSVACKPYEEDLVLHYYGELDSAASGRVKRHLDSCAPCRHFIDDLSYLLPQMSETKELPRSFWDGYFRETMDKVMAEAEHPAWWRRWFTLPQGWMVPAMGTAAVAVAALAMVLAKSGGPLRPDAPAVPIPQEILADSNQLEFFKSLELLESLDKLEKLDSHKPEGGASGGEFIAGGQKYA